MKTFAFACLLAASAVNAVSLGAEAETELGAEFSFGLGGGDSKGGFDIDGLIRKARTKINNKGSVSDEEEEEELENAFKLATEKEGSDNEGHTAIADLFAAGITDESEEEEVDEEAVEELKDEIATGFDNVQQKNAVAEAAALRLVQKDHKGVLKQIVLDASDDVEKTIIDDIKAGRELDVQVLERIFATKGTEIGESNEEQTKKVQNITKEAALVKIENEANKLNLLSKIDQAVEDGEDIEKVVEDAEAPLKIVNPEEGEDTEDELNKAQQYSKNGVVDLIDSFMVGNGAFDQLKEQNASAFANLNQDPMGFGLQKPDPSSLGKKSTRIVTSTPVKDAQKKTNSERHAQFVAAAEAAPQNAWVAPSKRSQARAARKAKRNNFAMLDQMTSFNGGFQQGAGGGDGGLGGLGEMSYGGPAGGRGGGFGGAFGQLNGGGLRSAGNIINSIGW